MNILTETLPQGLWLISGFINLFLLIFLLIFASLGLSLLSRRTLAKIHYAGKDRYAWGEPLRWASTVQKKI